MGRRTGWVMLGVLWGILPAAYAQDTGAGPVQPVAWSLLADGEPAPWPIAGSRSLDSLAVVAREVLAALQQEGHYLARMDSATLDATENIARLYVTRGQRVAVGRVRLEGMVALDSLALLRILDTRPGRVFDPQRLENDLSALLGRYERAGYPLVRLHLSEMTLLQGTSPRMNLTIQVTEGRSLVLRRVEVIGAERTRPGYAARVAGLRPGRRLEGYAPEEIRRRLQETAFFREVGEPEMVLESDSGAVVRLALTEEPPGSFDLVLGYLPAAAEGQTGSIVGNGHLVMRNLFGNGRTFALRLNRLPGQVSSVDVRLADPYLLGLPFGVSGRFQGLQQDSTYGKQSYEAELSYRFYGGLEAFTTVSQEQTSPGQAGIRLQRGRQRIPQASAFFAGLGMRYQRLDRLVNPRRGFVVETNFERGQKEGTALVRTADQDTTTERTLLRQERLQGRVRGYLPTFARQLVVLGGEAAVLLSNEYDESDLFRFGGATSLRGYDEERFRGRFVARAFAEYRYQIDRTSYAFLFFDLGFVETPSEVDREVLRGVYPGYGLGIQFSTTLGLINASYAVNNEDGPANGRIHVGLSFGL